MLYLIGLGLKPDHATLEALNALKSCDSAYVDRYTSDYSSGSIVDLEKIVGKQFFTAKRSDLEDKLNELVQRAKKESVALCVFGDVFFATTHDQLLKACREHGIQYQLIHGISVHNYLGDCGLSLYKFGGTVTIVSPKKDYAPESFYEKIAQNQKMGLHTLCLLDNRSGEGKPMNVGEAISLLQGIAKKRGQNFSNAEVVVLSLLGGAQQKIVFGKAGDLAKMSFKPGLQSLVVCGKLGEIERENLGAWKSHG